MPDATCQSCGAPLSPRFATARMVTCDHCGTSNVLVDDAFRAMGSAGTMQQAPALVRLDGAVTVEGLRLVPVGHARFDYGRGWWDEYWCLTDEGGLWLSVDEGDVALERPLPRDDWPRGFTPARGAGIRLGDRVHTLAETETATCLAVTGSFPEALSPGEAHLYADLTDGAGGIVTCERWDGGEAWFIGRWVDPWQVRAA